MKTETRDRLRFAFRVSSVSITLVLLTAIFLPSSPHRTEIDDLRGILVIVGFLLLAALHILGYILNLGGGALALKNAEELKHPKLYFALKVLFLMLLIVSLVWLLGRATA